MPQPPKKRLSQYARDMVRLEQHQINRSLSLELDALSRQQIERRAEDEGRDKTGKIADFTAADRPRKREG